MKKKAVGGETWLLFHYSLFCRLFLVRNETFMQQIFMMESGYFSVKYMKSPLTKACFQQIYSKDVYIPCPFQ